MRGLGESATADRIILEACLPKQEFIKDQREKLEHQLKSDEVLYLKKMTFLKSDIRFQVPKDSLSFLFQVNTADFQIKLDFTICHTIEH